MRLSTFVGGTILAAVLFNSAAFQQTFMPERYWSSRVDYYQRRLDDDRNNIEALTQALEGAQGALRFGIALELELWQELARDDAVGLQAAQHAYFSVGAPG